MAVISTPPHDFRGELIVSSLSLLSSHAIDFRGSHLVRRLSCTLYYRIRAINTLDVTDWLRPSSVQPALFLKLFTGRIDAKAPHRLELAKNDSVTYNLLVFLGFGTLENNFKEY